MEPPAVVSGGKVQELHFSRLPRDAGGPKTKAPGGISPAFTLAVTLRSLAALCDVSTATVSRALAGNTNVREQTRRRIQAVAQQHGYSRNELFGALMGHMRRVRTQAFIGNLAIVHVPKAGESRPNKQQRRIIQGATSRAKELGFQLYAMSLGEEGMRIEAVARQLRARGVLGLVFLYSDPLAKPLAFPWDDFVAVEIDYGQSVPLLHTICHDQYMSLTGSLARLKSAGYARVGLFLENFKDERIQFKWSAAFTSFQSRRGGIGNVPMLVADKLGEPAFRAWFSRYKPDLVVGHLDECVTWLKAMKRRVPDDVGFFSLNAPDGRIACAGIDPRLELQGSIAVESLVAQIQRNERGLPEVPRTVMVPGSFVAGPTVRVAAGT